MLKLPSHPLKILVVGSGGREHALVWKLAQSPLVKQIYCAPGNGGTAQENKSSNLNIESLDFPKLAQFCQDEQIDLTVVGPDNALAAGITNYFQSKKLRIFGPTKEAAQLEWSKSYAKQFMSKYNLPTANFKVCKSYQGASAIIEKESWVQIVKADGLALGKGVYVCNNHNEVQQALKEIFEQKKFGQAGETVILEEKLTGEEISLFLLCDGKQFIPFVPAQDYKRRFDNDQGPNTGGMGAISPPAAYEKYRTIIENTITKPLLEALIKEGINYQGLLYVGLLLDQKKNGTDAVPKILEFNARFGDPETQAVLPRLESDLLPALWACTEGKLSEVELSWTKEASCTIVAVTKTYPEKSASGQLITIGQGSESTYVFHAGTKIVDNELVTAGGRILAITALGKNLESAALFARGRLQNIHFENMDYRKDIAILKQEDILV